MIDRDEAQRWLAAAAEALQAARDNADRGWHNWACMIAEQGAQLAVKATLHAVGRGDLARGHDLVRLLDEAAGQAAADVADAHREAAVRLSRHYQPTRYPDALPGGTPHGRYGASDSSQALDDAASLVALAQATVEGLGDEEGRL